MHQFLLKTREDNIREKLLQRSEEKRRVVAEKRRDKKSCCREEKRKGEKKKIRVVEEKRRENKRRKNKKADKDGVGAPKKISVPFLCTDDVPTGVLAVLLESDR